MSYDPSIARPLSFAPSPVPLPILFLSCPDPLSVLIRLSHHFSSLRFLFPTSTLSSLFFPVYFSSSSISLSSSSFPTHFPPFFSTSYQCPLLVSSLSFLPPFYHICTAISLLFDILHSFSHSLPLPFLRSSPFYFSPFTFHCSPLLCISLDLFQRFSLHFSFPFPSLLPLSLFQSPSFPSYSPTLISRPHLCSRMPARWTLGPGQREGE